LTKELRAILPTSFSTPELPQQLPLVVIVAVLCAGGVVTLTLCVDRDALAAMLVAGVLTSDPAEAATIGCQTIPEDAKLELLERYPSVFPFMRMIRVSVTSPTQPDLTSGFTIEMGR